MKENRVERIMAALGEMGVSQMLIIDPMSIYYLTGVYNDPHERFYGLLLRADGKHAYFLNNLFSIPQEVGVEKVWYSDTDPAMEIVAKYLDSTAPLGVDKDLKARFLLPLMEMKAATGFVNTSLAIDTVRGIKDEEEQEKMRVSSHINDMAMVEFKKLIHAGVTEKEVAEQMLKIYLDLGADGFSFEPLVAFGPNAADPHHGPDDTVLKEGDVVLFDVGCIKDGYCSDMTRSFYYKTVSEEHKNIYNIVRAANEAAIAKIKPGVPLMELDNTARNLITEKGYGPQFNHRLGHFIGLAEHEFGDVSSVNTTPAVPGMIFSIEPGIYVAGDTGVRVEDLVLVTEDGCEVLNHYSKELEIIE
ncbi:M24 family metallopeptidase [Anaerotignum sp.]|nr:Xaa-Pro peptidase family protein [Anaerotignum sp.]MBQ7757780.1 aminopeptidase P family protein [Anaerotignum sp.]